MTRYRKSLAFFLAFVIVFHLAVIMVGNMIRPDWGHWGDEWHFQNTIKRFGEDISLYSLKHYEEMSTPLPFLAYALWGRMVGFELFDLRILSLITALITYLVFHRLLFVLIKDDRKVLWGAILLVVQPYMVGFSIFVYTDMIAILFLLLAVFGHVRRRPVILGLCLALAILSRQYMAFLAIAGAIYFLLEYFITKRRDSLAMLGAALLSTVPYLALAIWWGGLSPDSSLRQRYLDEGLFLHPEVVSLYVSLIVIYLFPLLIYYMRKFYCGLTVWVVALIGSAYYVIFPVGPSKPSLEVGITTVGLFHRLLRYLVGQGFWEHAVFYLGFVLAVPVIFSLGNDVIQRCRQHLCDNKLFLDLAVISFLVVMPFSYLGWEKYFLPVVPLLILRILMSRRWTAPGA